MESHDDPHTPDELLAQLGWVRALARRLVTDLDVTDDVLQQVCLLALRQVPQDARAGPRLRAWLATVTRTIVRNTTRSDLRRLRREQAAAQPEALPSTADLAAHREALRALIEALTCLNEPYYSTVVARYFDGRSVAEIAELTGMSNDAVRQQLSRARHQLRTHLHGVLADARGRRLAVALPLLPVAASSKAAPVKPLLAYIGGLLVTKSAGTAAGVAILAVVLLGTWYVVDGRPTQATTTSPDSLSVDGSAAVASAPLLEGPVGEPTALIPAASTPGSSTGPSPARNGKGTPPDVWPKSFPVVVTDGGARPVGDARIETWTVTRDLSHRPLAEVDSTLAFAQFTDGIGRAVVQLENKDQFVLARKEGVGRSARLTHYHLSRAANADGQSVIQLKPDVVVEGRVFRADGAPAPGIAIEVESTADRSSLERHVESAMTAPDGSFTIACLPTKGVSVAAIIEDGTRIEQRFDVPEDRHLTVTFHLPGDWWIDGTVVDPAGVAVPGAQVAIFHGTSITDAWLNQPDVTAAPERSNVRADEEGSFHYRVTALEPHVLVAIKHRPAAVSDPILVRLDEARTYAHATLQFTAPSSISGNVRDPAGEPLPGAVVAARVIGPPLLKLVQPSANVFFLGREVGATALAGQLGEFVLSPLHPQGSFDILLSPPGGKALGSSMLVAREDVPAGASGLDLTARFTDEQTRTGAIHLQAYAAATGLPVEVRVYSIALEGKVAGAEVGAGRANGGLVRIEKLVPGEAYTVALTVPDMSAVDVHGLVASEAPDVVRVAVPASGQLDVEANDAQGLPLPLVEVSVHRTYEPIGFNHHDPVFTDAQGRARFTTLDPGRFRVSFTVDGVETEALVDVAGGQSAFLRMMATGEH